MKLRSRPLHGVLLSQSQISKLAENMSEFSSPPRGSLISIVEIKVVAVLDVEFSSPPRGSLISIRRKGWLLPWAAWVLVPSTGFSYLNQRKMAKRIALHRSRPLHGVLLSQCLETWLSVWCFYVLVPSTGFSYLNKLKRELKLKGKKRSRPLHGVLLSQYCPLHLLKHRAFIPHLRGKPANERNLNIKLVYNIHKAWF